NMKRLTYLPAMFLFGMFLALSACQDAAPGKHTDDIPFTYSEKYRPQFHFTPKANWMGAPGGLVYGNGRWHLFYEHNPWGDTPGNHSWGHAVTRDLIGWAHEPIAMYATGKGADSTLILPGSALLDRGNRAKICPDGTQKCLVAFYTSDVQKKGETTAQYQSMAYSTDDGMTWTPYAENPIVDLGNKSFRDPKVFWHTPSRQWVMVVASPPEHKVIFYGSKDLKAWEKLSEFSGIGDLSKEWERPDLFELKVMNEPGVSKWILMVSGGNEHTATFGVQYFIGQFDGQKFTLDPDQTGSHYLDHGKDFYAASTWNNDPYDRTLMIGSMNNPEYADKMPTGPWAGTQSLVRRLVMFRSETDSTYKVYQVPIRELENYRGTYGGYTDLKLPCEPRLFEKIRFTSGEIQAVLAPYGTLPSDDFGVKVFVSKDDKGNIVEETIVGYNMLNEFLYIDRSRSGIVDLNDGYPERVQVPIKLKDGKIIIHIFIDESTVEVFANNGEAVLSTRVFPTMHQGGIELFAHAPGRAVAEQYNCWEYKSTWEQIGLKKAENTTE
ncbi:MAG: glycoside hydrolase family 32 protein, partial [Bacteroidetes bacterium]